MITDTLENARWYYPLHPRLEQGLRWLTYADVLSLATGRHAIDGDYLFALINDYQTRPVSEAKWEAHRRYWDVQYLARGTEQVGFAPLANMREITPYNAERDIAWFEGRGDFITLVSGSFAILAPHDVHAPGLSLATANVVRKIVIKVDLS